MLLDEVSTNLCSYAMTCVTLCAPCDPGAIRIISNDELPSSQVAGLTSSGRCQLGGRMQIRHGRRMLRFNAVQLWENLQRLGWWSVPPQW
jgi:hypothetical protein